MSYISNKLYSVWRFYVDGFKSMTIGKTLWAIILIKLFIFFAILKLFFFPDLLEVNYDNDADRAEAVRSAFTSDSNPDSIIKNINHE